MESLQDVLVLDYEAGTFVVKCRRISRDTARGWCRGYNREEAKEKQVRKIAVRVPSLPARCYEARGQVKLVIVKPKGFKPSSWQERPERFKVVEIVRELEVGESCREFTMGFNFQSLKEGAKTWAVAIGEEDT
jgi:hypothetical protein